MTQNSSEATHHPAVKQETTDINVRAVLLFGLGLFVAAAAIHVVVWLLFLYFSGREAAQTTAPAYPLAAAQESRLPPEPRLQTNPREDLRALREHEEEILNGYGWVDKSAGVVRIPIDEAMKLTVQRGLPVRPSGQER